MGATAHPTCTVPCCQPWHRGNNPNIYSSAFCQGQQFFKLLIRSISRLTSASQILAIIIFIASYCESEVVFVSVSPWRATWQGMSVGSKAGGAEAAGVVLPLLPELQIHCWHRQCHLQGHQHAGLSGNGACLGAQSHPTEQGRAGGASQDFPAPVCPSQLLRQHRRSFAHC